ncbi:MAG: lysophospholipid acyltransferase family protein [Syntrophaceae bacterium]
MDFRFKKVTRTRQFHSFLYRFIRLYSWTFRIRIENEKEWMDYHRNGGRVLLCAWHQQFFSAIRHFQNYRGLNPSLMISKSRDGEMIASVALRSGWHVVRGSSSNGGRSALSQMIKYLRKSGLAAHIVDGPRGPAGEVKSGTIKLAQSADAAIIPFYTSADRSWSFKSWDSFFLPKPFARVVLTFGDMIKYDSTETQDEFEVQRKYLESIMQTRLRAIPSKSKMAGGAGQQQI